MAMLPISSESNPNVGVLIIDAESLTKLIPELVAHVPSSPIMSTNPLRLSPKIADGRIIGFEIVKNESLWLEGEVPGFPPTE